MLYLIVHLLWETMAGVYWLRLSDHCHHTELVCHCRKYLYNMTNGLSCRYHLGESTFIFGDIRCDFRFLFTFSMNFPQANRKVPDGTPHFAASHLGLFCLPMSHKKDVRLKRVKLVNS